MVSDAEFAAFLQSHASVDGSIDRAMRAHILDGIHCESCLVMNLVLVEGCSVLEESGYGCLWW